MFDLPPHQPSHQPYHQPYHRLHPPRAARPRRYPGESVDGWVTAEITAYPRPLRLASQSNAASLAEGFTVQDIRSLEQFWEAQYAPPAAQFVLAVVEYPSGPVSQWIPLHWPAVEIVLRSPEEWPAGGDTPPESPQLRRLVDDLARQALAGGWEPAGHGRTWCSLRFRRQYDRLEGILRWK